MERVIHFQVSIAGQHTIIEEVRYEQKEHIEPLSAMEQMRFYWKQATDALREQIGHDDYEIHYWWWIK